MSHPRKQIRANVVALLTGLTGVTTVDASRVTPFADSELPALNVVNRGGQSSPITLTGSGPQERQINVGIDIHAKATDGVDDLLDDIAERVEAELLGASPDTWLGGYVGEISDEPDFDDETNLPAGVLRLVVSISTIV